MAFTAEEQAVLAQLSYLDIETSELNPVSLYDVLNNENYREKLNKALSGDPKSAGGYEDVLTGLINKVEGQDYHIVKSVNDRYDTGFSAIAISDPNNDVTVACRGTEDLTKVGRDEDSNRDALTDVQIGLQKETNQQQELEKFIDDLEDCGYDGYYFTGHSLGGNLAIHGAIYVGDPDKVKGVTTYNAPGFNPKYWDIHAMRIMQLAGKITNYENQYDIVSEIFVKPGETVYLECNNPGDINHLMNEFKMVDGGFVPADGKSDDRQDLQDFIINEVLDLDDKFTILYLLYLYIGYKAESDGTFDVDGKSGTRSRVVDFLLNELLELDTYWSLNILGTYLYNKVTGGPINGYRDFSQAALKTMTDAARETEEEAWWRIDRWDCWYRADKLLGGFVMDFQRLSGQVDTYYRKVIDMNDASVKDIEKIFQKVYSLDDTYSARIRSGNSQLQTQILKKLQDLADSISPKVCSPYTNEE